MLLWIHGQATERHEGVVASRGRQGLRRHEWRLDELAGSLTRVAEASSREKSTACVDPELALILFAFRTTAVV